MLIVDKNSPHCPSYFSNLKLVIFATANIVTSFSFLSYLFDSRLWHYSFSLYSDIILNYKFITHEMNKIDLYRDRNKEG